MATSKPAGYGQEAYGDPMGGGGPLHVVRAVALTSRSIRVVFNEAPLFKSPSGVQDARNPTNFLFKAVEGLVIDPSTGEVTSPIAVGVDKVLAKPPAIGLLLPEERGVDVHTDRALTINVRYEVEVVTVRADAGGALGAPTTAQFVGMQPIAAVRPRRQPSGLADIEENIESGRWVTNDSGDLRNHDGDASLRKRVFRRFATPKGAFSWLPGYGIGLQLKEPGSVSVLQELKSDAEEQLAQEPEVASARIELTLDAQGVLTVESFLRTVKGAIIPVSVLRLADGTVVA